MAVDTGIQTPVRLGLKLLSRFDGIVTRGGTGRAMPLGVGRNYKAISMALILLGTITNFGLSVETTKPLRWLLSFCMAKFSKIKKCGG